MDNVLVAYFSASGRTRKRAIALADYLKADLYEIKPKIPYTRADLNWLNKNSRSSIEMNDKSSRPELRDRDLRIEKYDIILLGFPIWWYVAPTIINTFLEAYDFSNKKIILFATSGSSGFGKTIDKLKSSVKNAEIIEGKMLNGFSIDKKIEELSELVKNSLC